MDLDELPEFQRKEIRKKIDSGKTENEIENDLRTNPKYRVFFDRYREKDVDGFIKHYKFKKNLWLQYGDMYKKREERSILIYTEMAEERIWEIQQKKLFNMQCLWRAGDLKIEGVQICYEFEYWSYYIKECPFLSPISREEFDIYREFVLTDEYELEDWFSELTWQDFRGMKDEYTGKTDEVYIPDWYEFYDMRMATGYLLTLPDIKGEKEKFYRNIYRENDKKMNPDKYKSNTVINRDEWLSPYDIDKMKEFVEMFEEPKVIEYFRLMELEEDNKEDEEVVNAIEILQRVKNIDIINRGNWRDSILYTVDMYQKQCLYDALEKVYANYISRMNMGIGYAEEDEDRIYTQKTIEEIKEQIIIGRELNGEPRDFNY